ncbi:MAG TPA: hypothetical protein DEF45_16355 [Rhodopirellula sp.]|nr:hypothetical protein [Rhodopirellula sp.]
MPCNRLLVVEVVQQKVDKFVSYLRDFNIMKQAWKGIFVMPWQGPFTDEADESVHFAFEL